MSGCRGGASSLPGLIRAYHPRASWGGCMGRAEEILGLPVGTMWESHFSVGGSGSARLVCAVGDGFGGGPEAAQGPDRPEARSPEGPQGCPETAQTAQAAGGPDSPGSPRLAPRQPQWRATRGRRRLTGPTPPGDLAGGLARLAGAGPARGPSLRARRPPTPHRQGDGRLDFLAWAAWAQAKVGLCFAYI